MKYFDQVRDRVYNQNKNWLCVVLGETGSGKSYCAMTIAELLDPEFNIDRVCFTPREFMNLLNSGGLKKGSAIILDEAGILLSSRNWYSVTNKLINYVLQSFRHRNLFCLFTTPSISFLDSQARLLFHDQLEPIKIVKSENKVICKLKHMQVNVSKGKIYRKYHLEPKNVVLHRFHIFLPSQKLIRDYEKKKEQYTRELGIDIENTLTRMDEQEKRTPTNEEYVDRLKAIMEEKGLKVITLSKIQGLLGVSLEKARIIRGLL